MCTTLQWQTTQYIYEHSEAHFQIFYLDVLIIVELHSSDQHMQ